MAINSSDIKTYMREYCKIVSLLLENEKGILKTNNLYAVDKDIVVKLLSQYKYDLVNNKLKIWRTLKWIQTDKNRFTKNVRVPHSNSFKRMIIIDLNIYYFLLKYI